MDVHFRNVGRSNAKNLWGQSFLVGIFPVLFIISGLLLPSGDSAKYPQFAVLMPLFLCGAIVMFVSAKLREVLRRTKIILGLLYVLIVIELVVCRIMAT